MREVCHWSAEWNWRRKFVSDVFHTLSQPLTALQCSLELALGKQTGPDESHRELEEAAALVARVIETTRLIRSNVEAEDPGDCVPCSVSGLIGDVRKELQPVAQSLGSTLISRCEEANVLADPGKLKNIFFMLTDLALYQAVEPLIEMSCHLHGNKVFVVIGAGFPSGADFDIGRTTEYEQWTDKSALLARSMVRAIGGQLWQQRCIPSSRWVVQLPVIGSV